MNVGVVLFPSNALQEQANAYRMRYDSHYSLISPHITIKEAFSISEDDLSKTVETLREIAAKAKPAVINVYKVDSFYPQSNTIFFKIAEHETLTHLYQKLHSEPFSANTKYGFIPHLTIGQDLSDTEHADILGRMQMKKIEHEEIIDHMHLLNQQENGTWTVYETFRLGKDN